MTQRYIYISEELNNKLKDVNASALITRLLIDYFKSNETIESKEEKLKKLEEEERYRVNVLQKTSEELETEIKQDKELKESENKQEERRIKHREDKINNIIKNAKEVYNADLTREEAIEYADGYIDNLIDYLKSKGKV